MPFFRVVIPLFFALVSANWALEIFINRAYTTAETAEARLYASSEGTLFMRIYRIEDVHGYLSGQKNAHTVTEANERLMQPGYFLWRSVVENMEHAIYQFARHYMRKDFRERLRLDLGLEKYAFPFRDRFPETNLFSPLKFPIVAELEKTVRARHWVALRHQFQKLEAGYYLVEVSQGRHIAHTPLVISGIAVVTKTSPYNMLAYAVNLSTGEPLGSATLYAYTRKEKDFQLQKRISLKNGIAIEDDTKFLEHSENTLFILEQGKHLAFSDIYQLDFVRRRYEAAIYTDRPVYRIGDIVEARAVVFKKQGAAASGNTKYHVKSSDDEEVAAGEANLSAAGSVSFSVKTQNLKPGRFTITLEFQGEKHSGSFMIEQYKKPETRAAMTADAPTLLAGGSLKATLSAAYYSGEPLASVPLEVVVERQRISYPWWYGMGYEDYYGEHADYYAWDFVKDFTATTDAQGRYAINWPSDAKPDGDFNYRVRATVKAANREETSASARFKVYRAPVALRLSQERWYFTSNSRIAFKIHASDIYSAKPVKTKVNADLLFRTYDAKTQKYNDAPVTSAQFETNEVGEASGEFPAQKTAGTYLVIVSAEKGGQRTSETLETYVYAAGEIYGEEGESVERTVHVTPGKKQYKVGETAEFAIRLPGKKKLPVLVTVENDRIRKHTLLSGTETNFIYKEELTPALSPNFELHVVQLDLDKAARVYSGSATLVLPPAHRILKLEVIADRDKYRPGEEANFIVKTFDYKNAPVAAEFSLGVVDEAIYAIREDSLKSLELELNPKLYHSVVTQNSLAFSFYGYGAEKSLYALYREQMTEAAALRKGESQKVKIRKNFKDTAFFNAHGKTGADGLAKVKVTLPDNLTEWRITTHAHTQSGLSATARSKALVSKDFALRLAQPRFLRERDEAKLRLLVSNQLKDKQTAKFEVNLQSLKLEKPFPVSLEIPAGTERYVDFTVLANFYPKDGKSTLNFIAKSEADSDGLEISLPVLPYGVENFIADQKVFAADEHSWKSNLKLDADARSELGELQVSFIPGVIPAVLETLPYLIQFPYGCVEQTLSTFLPAIWASRAAAKLKLPLPVKDSELKDITEAGLKKLYGYQHADGGWGWWSDDPTDDYMTAYVLWGLKEASAAGTAIDEQVLARGTKHLLEKINLAKLNELKDSYAIHRVLFAQKIALTLKKKGPAVAAIKEQWAALLARGFVEPTGLALIVEGAHAAKFKDMEVEAMTRLSRIAKKNAQGRYFEHQDKKGYYWYNDREETTAQVLNAMLMAGNAEQKDVIAYLISQKKQRRWRSTRLSALITRAFAEYAIQTGEKLKKVSVTAEVGGERRDVTYDPKKSKSSDLLLLFKTSARDAQIKFTRDSDGFFLARAEWKHYLNKPLIVPREGNFKMGRRFFALTKNEGRYAKGEAKYAFKAGELVMTEVDLTANKGAEYLLVEDMIPAGFEPLTHTELLTLGEFRYDNYGSSPAAVTRLDDRVALAKTYLSGDKFVPRSFYRAVFPGKYQTMPAQGGLMYYPETYAWSASDVITIGE